jgi:hypothetical protein
MDFLANLLNFLLSFSEEFAAVSVLYGTNSEPALIRLATSPMSWATRAVKPSSSLLKRLAFKI